MSGFRFYSCLIAGLVLTLGRATYADEITCGSLSDSAWLDGPKDYRSASKADRDIVERAHFNANVESLRSAARSTSSAGPDIDYTLRAFPNHPRALLAMSRLSLKEGREKPAGARYTIECYFERANRFRPNDPMPYLIAGLHFAKTKQNKAATENLDRASALGDRSNANAEYNLGLGYLEVGLLEKSLEHAKRAYALGFPLPGLKKRLAELGVWKE